MKIFITGGAGFLGSNLAAKFSQDNHEITILDNFSRPGSEKNAEWLKPMGIKIIKGDIREKVPFDAEHYDQVFHLAGQVTVTESIVNPYEDFENNTLGTLNVLEYIRKSSRKPALLFSSTNKVYGHIGNARPINENEPLDLLSPYGCSKGAADQYVLDYGRTYGLKTVVLRQSCIYGERQFGMLGQGWISWFALKILRGEPITIFGDGRQVRDILHVDDFVNIAAIALNKGDGVYNIGGGESNTISVLEAIERLEKMTGKIVEKRFGATRVGDQEYYVSDITKAQETLGWEPKVKIEEGLNRLVEWTKQTI
ncbi:MAG: hypothetical protein A2544_01110 [Candidatus Zambryskibacteria bacterium RIFOXYD2_FULL_43_10]|uniref:NAD-dependent epimerase/dehydratase domain-containing protein n=1 Tax=Candidatus Zambryskibacteria bacterium RIFOXYD2_FULL_43_10 TaxID=1802782 RepID=A0A1G2V663_9BACT|nr:MAG: hypothetical protein A2544_01110 [Candidatus Zambryskibacteria bacterium RIFOXYD2_FULL_43_10]